MFCQICGAQLRSTARFCNHCGKPVAERFGGARLQPPDISPPTAPVPPPTQYSTLETVQAPTTPELAPKPQTDQIAHRGTERQPHAKTTAQEAEAVAQAKLVGAPLGAITNVSEEVSPKESFGAVSRASTLVEEASLSETPSIPDSATEPLQYEAAAKPFFTQLISPQANNRQHSRLARAVPLVVLALLLLLIFAYIASK
jgi:hypothetical protein